MYEELVMNKLPYPKYFNGIQWNTVLFKSRKSIPKYLHGDLPKLKHQLLKQQFKEASKFQCPRLDYFRHFITHQCAKPSHKIQNKQQKKNKRNKLAMKQSLQYSILLNDNNSNVLKQLFQKSQQLDKKEQIQKSCSSPKCLAHSPSKSKPKSETVKQNSILTSRTQNIQTLASANFQRSISVSVDQTPLNSIQHQEDTLCGCQKKGPKKRKHKNKYEQQIKFTKCFDTIGLVFKQKKDQLTKIINSNPQQIVLPNIYGKIQEIKLLELQN